MRDWLKIIYAIAPHAKADVAHGLADAMPDIIEKFDIDTPLRQAHFLAQCAHESAGFRTTVEYATGDAYDTRTDLGFTKARDGDGRKFKGFGLIQTTGPANQKKVAEALEISAEWKKNPRILATFPYAALSAGFYWADRGLNRYADRDDVLTVTKRVNGGTNGLADRKTYLKKAKVALAGAEPEEVAKVGTVLSRAKVKALQTELSTFYPLGVPDGIAGRNTVKAISAFQTDNDIPVSGAFDEATVAAIEAGVEPPSLPADIANSKPKGSRILEAATALKATSAVGVIAPAVASLAEDPLSSLEKATGLKTRIDAILEPFGGVKDLIGSHWPILVIGIGVAIFYFAHKIAKARIEDHQTGKMP